MRIAIRIGLALVAAACFAQTADPNQKLLDEMKAVRAGLDRLLPLMESLEKTQRAILAFQQIQVYDGQLRALEAQRDALADREGDLAQKASVLGTSARALEFGVGPTGAPGVEMDSAHRRDLADRFAASTRLLDANRARQQALEREIAALRNRIAALDKAAQQILAK